MASFVAEMTGPFPLIIYVPFGFGYRPFPKPSLRCGIHTRDVTLPCLKACTTPGFYIMSRQVCMIFVADLMACKFSLFVSAVA